HLDDVDCVGPADREDDELCVTDRVGERLDADARVLLEERRDLRSRASGTWVPRPEDDVIPTTRELASERPPHDACPQHRDPHLPPPWARSVPVTIWLRGWLTHRVSPRRLPARLALVVALVTTVQLWQGTASTAATPPLTGIVVGIDPGHNGLNGADPAYVTR